MHPIGILLVLLFALGAPAAAQAPNLAPTEAPVIPDAKTLAANYELSSALGDRKCALTLDAKPVGPGFTLVYDKTLCRPLFGFLSETVAWLPGIAGAIRFVNAGRRTVSEFTEGVGGRYEALRENEKSYALHLYESEKDVGKGPGKWTCPIPKKVAKGTSEASRPVPIRTRSRIGESSVGSNNCQRPPRKASNTA